MHIHDSLTIAACMHAVKLIVCCGKSRLVCNTCCVTQSAEWYARWLFAGDDAHDQHVIDILPDVTEAVKVDDQWCVASRLNTCKRLCSLVTSDQWPVIWHGGYLCQRCNVSPLYWCLWMSVCLSVRRQDYTKSVINPFSPTLFDCSSKMVTLQSVHRHTGLIHPI